MRFWLVLVLLFSFSFVNSQTSVCALDESYDTISHGINFEYKQRTEKFSSLLYYTALKFPELKGYTIEVKRKKITTMMAARPKNNFLFHKKNNRTYVILITDKQNMNAEILYNDMSACAISGVLGHELSHITTYTHKSNFALLCFGFKYMFHRKEIEKETDLIAINHGFGKGLVEYNSFIHHSPWVNKKYLRHKSKYYLSVAELNESIDGSL